MSWLPWRKRNGSKNIAKAASWFQLSYRAGLDPRKLGRLSVSCPWTEKIPVFSKNLFGCTENSEHMVWREDWWAGVWSETDSRDGDCNPPTKGAQLLWGPSSWAEFSSLWQGSIIWDTPSSMEIAGRRGSTAKASFPCWKGEWSGPGVLRSGNKFVSQGPSVEYWAGRKGPWQWVTTSHMS